MTRSLMTYEVLSPHDQCTIEAASDAVACVAILLLGEGTYGCSREDGAIIPTLVPGDSDHALNMALDGAGVARFEDAEANERLAKFIELRATDIAEALESLVYADLQTRKVTLSQLHPQPPTPDLIASYNHARRTSGYCLATKAVAFAKRLRARHDAKRAVLTGSL